MFKALIVALAAVAAAVPTSPSRGDNVNKCANGTKLRCCNKDVDTQVGIPIDAINLTCPEVPIIGGVLSNKCIGQTACCSNVQQNGLVNVACMPVNA